MDLITPQLGLLFWQTVLFLLLLFILTKFAWKPIMASLHEREDSIGRCARVAGPAEAQESAVGRLLGLDVSDGEPEGAGCGWAGCRRRILRDDGRLV